MNAHLLLLGFPAAPAAGGASALTPPSPAGSGSGLFAGLFSAELPTPLQQPAPSGLLWRPLPQEGPLTLPLAAHAPPPDPVSLFLRAPDGESPVWEILAATPQPRPVMEASLAPQGTERSGAEPLRLRLELPVFLPPAFSPSGSAEKSLPSPESRSMVHISRGGETWTPPVVEAEGALYVQLPSALFAHALPTATSYPDASPAPPAGWLAFVPRPDGAVRVEIVPAPPEAAASVAQAEPRAQATPAVPAALQPLVVHLPVVGEESPRPPVKARTIPGAATVVALPGRPAKFAPLPDKPAVVLPKAAEAKQVAGIRLGLGRPPSAPVPAPPALDPPPPHGPPIVAEPPVSDTPAIARPAVQVGEPPFKYQRVAPQPATDTPAVAQRAAPVERPVAASPSVVLVGVTQSTPERVMLDLELVVKQPAGAEKTPVFPRLPVLSEAVQMRIESAGNQPVSGEPVPMTKSARPGGETIPSPPPPQAMRKVRADAPAPEPPPVMAAVKEKAISAVRPEPLALKTAGGEARVLSDAGMAERFNATPLPELKETVQKPAEKANGQPRLSADAFAQGKSESPLRTPSERSSVPPETTELRVVSTTMRREAVVAAGERSVLTPATAGGSIGPAGPAVESVLPSGRPSPAVATPQPELVEQVVQNARMMLEQGRSTLSLRLHPEHLGRLDIRLVQEGDRVTAQLRVHEARAGQLLARNFDQLSRMLESAGLKVQQISVHTAQVPATAAAGHEPSPWDRQPLDHGERQGQQHARHGGQERRGQPSPHDWNHQEWWG